MHRSAALHIAEELYQVLPFHAVAARLLPTPGNSFWQLIEEKLRLDWSPEQVGGWLANQKQARLAAQRVSHERIHLHIYADKKRGGTLHEHLRCQKKRRKRYGSGRSWRGEIVGRVPIEERPAIVEERTRVGDWELDSIIGKGHQGAIVSLVDRTSRLTLLQKVEARTAELVAKALAQQLSGKCVLTWTSDNGKEFAHHQQVALAVEAEFFLANPYCSWERGTHENTTGLVRQYLPKGSDFATLTNHDVQLIAHKLNHRPRKTLGFQTPHQVYEQLTDVALTT